MVILTDHAKAQMRRREISEDEVYMVLSNSAETLTTRANRFVSYTSVQEKYIVVIYEKSIRNEDVVITVMRVDRKRLARFGFAQV